METFSIANCECVFVDVMTASSKNVRYGVIYQPPDTTAEASLNLFDKIFTLLKV